jgi:hypothetical protein
MSTTRKQTATVVFPWSTMGFATIEPRPIHKPIMTEEHDAVEIKTEDGNIFYWDPNGDVIRTSPSGEVTTWWGIPTMSEMINRPEDGTFCQFYSDGRVTMSLNNFTWFWGPLETGRFIEGSTRVVRQRCGKNCECWEQYSERRDDYRD